LPSERAWSRFVPGDNLREVRVSDLVERGDISVKKPDFVRS